MREFAECARTAGDRAIARRPSCAGKVPATIARSPDRDRSS